MRTTLNLQDELLAKAKAFAALNGITLTRLIEDGLDLRMKQAAAPRGPIGEMPVFIGGGGMRGGLSGLSTREMLDYLDEQEGPGSHAG